MSNGKSPYIDLAVFLAVLLTGVVLAAVTHVPIGSIAELAVALSALYTAHHQNDKDS